MIGESRRRTTAIEVPRLPGQAANQAIRDVSQLAEDVRECDPTDVWREIQSWSLARITTALVAACAAIDPDQSLTKRLEWTTQYATDDTADSVI